MTKNTSKEKIKIYEFNQFDFKDGWASEETLTVALSNRADFDSAQEFFSAYQAKRTDNWDLAHSPELARPSNPETVVLFLKQSLERVGSKLLELLEKESFAEVYLIADEWDEKSAILLGAKDLILFYEWTTGA